MSFSTSIITFSANKRLSISFYIFKEVFTWAYLDETPAEIDKGVKFARVL